ncbi:hypothetical protein Amir_4406 [Actinosynnema mirum DSM 43827]|uniref:Uncharacterized protein n=1 Tax=Actinosynnema mirum (strain ATCC 29888 / DSM 43827 / JCM 3225 / NBRC 14064 / NCIMB 13271 / NRRL B-12336 / IMRU 3971 / 101) TaxID=446462 RepID=C6WK41_ACTMD|nr:hypothetical protein Amir_4406 [Actinosynnema mirum DSM 43827]
MDSDGVVFHPEEREGGPAGRSGDPRPTGGPFEGRRLDGDRPSGEPGVRGVGRFAPPDR